VRFFLGLDMLPNPSVISFTLKVRVSNLICDIDARKHRFYNSIKLLFELDNGHVCYSRKIYPANGLSKLNKHLDAITCRTETTQDGPEIVQVLHRALNFCVYRQ